ncbi:MAG: hypothetical protein ACTSRU_07575 [Candidatus Hodarchaeales archaeon]
MAEEMKTSETGKDVTKDVVKAVNKILEVYLNQVFGPLVRDVKKIDKRITRIEAELAKINKALAGLNVGPIRSTDRQGVADDSTSDVQAKVAASAADKVIDADLAATISRKEYIHKEMVKAAEYFDATDYSDSMLFEKKDIKEKIKYFENFLNKEAGTSGTPGSVISTIHDLIKILRDTEYKLNSSAQARFYKEDFVSFLGKDAAKQIRRKIREFSF